MKPLCIDLFCGLGGWTEGFLAEGYRVVGFDIEVRPYPGQLVIQDVLTIHGSQFKDAAYLIAMGANDAVLESQIEAGE